MERIYLSPPDVGELEFQHLKSAFDSNWIAPVGPYIKKFEDQIGQTTGANHSVAVSSGTAALFLALKIAGVKPGDKVLCSDFTFIGSASPICHVGAEPVFVDAEAASWNLDPALLAEEIEQLVAKGKKPAAVIAVHIFGQAADLDPILTVCEKHDVPLIEDAAEALGATYRNQPVGTIGRFGVYSFNGNKILTTSGGGILTCLSENDAEIARYLSTQARSPLAYYEHEEVGYNFRLSNLLAAIGYAQLQTLEKKIAARKRTFKRYQELLADISGIDFMPIAGFGEPNFWLTSITLKPNEASISAQELVQQLNRKGIEARHLWKPMHQQPVFKECRFVGTGYSTKLFSQGLSLPSGSNLTDDQQDRVVGELISALA